MRRLLGSLTVGLGIPLTVVVALAIGGTAASAADAVPALACTADWDGEDYTLSFDGTAGRAAHLRISGRWKANVTDQTDYAGTTDALRESLLIRHWFGGESVDVTCVDGALPEPPNPPVQPPAVGDAQLPLGCTVTRTSTVTLTFDDEGSSIGIRKIGRWVARSRGATSWEDPNGPADIQFDIRSAYAIVRQIDGDRYTIPCVEADENPPACMSLTSKDGAKVLLVWADLDESVVFRKNDRWFATPPDGEQVRIDRTGSLGDDYVLRAWTDADTATDFSCRKLF